MTKYDIHFQQISKKDQLELVDGKVFTFGFKSAVGVSGPQKMVNRWVKCLLTSKGSDVMSANYGTGFNSLIGSNITSKNDLADALTLFIEDCNSQMRSHDWTNFPPDDERFDSANLVKLTITDGGFEAVVLLRNVLGRQVQVNLPEVSTR